MKLDGQVSYGNTTEQCNADQAIGRFNAIVNQCSSTQDTNARNTFLDSFKTNYISSLDNLNTQITNMKLVNGVGQSSTVASTIGSMKTSLESEKAKLEREKTSLSSQIETADKDFMESLITKEEPGKNNLLTLQDIALAIFVLGWFLMGLTLIYLRTAGPTGSLRGGLIVLVIFFFASALLYMILQQVV